MTSTELKPRLSGKTAIVTGSGQNIGRAIAELFAAQGADVVVNGSKNRENIDRTVEAINAAGGNAIGVMADVGDPEQVRAMVEEAEKSFGGVDIAVSNVSVRIKYAFEDITVEDWRRTLNSNLSSCFYLAHYVLPGMRERGWGRIIHISGYDGFTGHVPHRAANVTSKAGMHALAKAIAREYGVHKVTANSVVVGAIDTSRAENQHYEQWLVDRAKALIPSGEMGEPNDIAEACLYLASDSAKFVNGQAIHVNGGEYMF